MLKLAVLLPFLQELAFIRKYSSKYLNLSINGIYYCWEALVFGEWFDSYFSSLGGFSALGDVWINFKVSI